MSRFAQLRLPIASTAASWLPRDASTLRTHPTRRRAMLPVSTLRVPSQTWVPSQTPVTDAISLTPGRARAGRTGPMKSRSISLSRPPEGLFVVSALALLVSVTLGCGDDTSGDSDLDGSAGDASTVPRDLGGDGSGDGGRSVADGGEEPDASTPSAIVLGELKAFPTAHGYGAFAAGGRGGRIIEVSSYGDLRDAINAEGARIMVFSRSGYMRAPPRSSRRTTQSSPSSARPPPLPASRCAAWV